MPWPERSPLPAGAGPPRARAFPRGGGWGRARPPRAGRAAEGCGPPGGVGGCPTAGPDGSNKRRGSGRGHPVSCPLSLGRAGGAFPSLSLSESGPRGAQSRPQPPLPPVPAPGRAAGGRGPGPHRPRVFPPGAAAPSPAPALPRRKSRVPEVPPDGSSAISYFRSGRGAAAAAPGSGGDGTRTGTGILRPGPCRERPHQGRAGAGGGAGQGQRPAKTVRGAGDPRRVPLGLCGEDRALGVPGSGAGRTGPSASRGCLAVSRGGRQEGPAPRSPAAARSQPPRPAAARPWRTTCASWAAP